MRFRAALLLAALAGFVGLAYEVLWYRALSYATGSAPWVFGALLGAYLLGVACASFAARAMCVRYPSPGRREAGLVAAFVAIATVAAFLVIPALAAAAVRLHWAAALPLLSVAAGLLGAVLPLSAHFAIAPGEESGLRLSHLYVADIVGSALGSALTGYVLLDIARTPTVSVLLAAAGFALMLAVVAAGGFRRSVLVGTAVAAVLATAGGAAAAPRLFDRLWERLQWKREDVGRRFTRVVENRHGVIAVTAEGTLYGGGAYDGAFSTDPINDRNGIYRAYAVGVLHPAPRRVLLIGLGSGSWAQVLSHLGGVERLTAIDINPGYVELIREQPEVSSLLSNPMVELVVDDARRWLSRHPDRRFDVIVANVTLHWRDHATNLLSREFVELVRAHLEAGGIYYFNTTFFAPARETALSVFANGIQVGTFFAASDEPLEWDGPGFARVVAAVQIDGRPVVDQARPEGQAWLAGLSEQRWRAYHPDQGARIITDDNMLPEWHGNPFIIPEQAAVTRGTP